jgi:hypothetical protein
MPQRAEERTDADDDPGGGTTIPNKTIYEYGHENCYNMDTDCSAMFMTSNTQQVIHHIYNDKIVILPTFNKSKKQQLKKLGLRTSGWLGPHRQRCRLPFRTRPSLTFNAEGRADGHPP